MSLISCLANPKLGCDATIFAPDTYGSRTSLTGRGEPVPIEAEPVAWYGCISILITLLARFNLVSIFCACSAVGTVFGEPVFLSFISFASWSIRATTAERAVSTHDWTATTNPN